MKEELTIDDIYMYYDDDGGDIGIIVDGERIIAGMSDRIECYEQCIINLLNERKSNEH